MQCEEDLNSLQKKYANLENEFDKANEGLIEANTKLEASEKRVNEVSTLASAAVVSTLQLVRASDLNE